jgi:hypothetical protein
MTKKALLIGINYLKTSAELSGCIYDAENVHQLIKVLYKDTVDVRFLHENSSNKNLHPTKLNIIKGIEWLLNDTKEGDSLFIHYSGHGGSVPDKDNDELDRRDETIIPLDYLKMGQMTDDELRVRLIDKLPPGVKLTCLFDCCHAGTILDLKYGYIQPQTGILKIILNNHPETKNEIVLLSGCKDEQYGWEVYDEKKIQGAMTNSFVKSMKQVFAKTFSFKKTELYIHTFQKLLEMKELKEKTKKIMKKRKYNKYITIYQESLHKYFIELYDSDNHQNQEKTNILQTMRKLYKAIKNTNKLIRKFRKNKKKIIIYQKNIQNYQLRIDNSYATLLPLLSSEQNEQNEQNELLISYSDFMGKILENLKAGGDKQDPQLSSGKQINLSDTFSLF